MEVEKICSLVKAAWIFNKKNYPTYLRFTPVQQQVFALNNVLKHQAKAHNILSCRGRWRSDMQDEVQNVLFNSVRFATLLEMESEKIAELLSEWKEPDEGAVLSRKLNFSLHNNMYMIAALKRFQWTINNAFALLEPCDRGGRFYKAKLQKVAAECIRESLEMAACAAYTREEFETWLESGNAIKSLVA